MSERETPVRALRLLHAIVANPTTRRNLVYAFIAILVLWASTQRLRPSHRGEPRAVVGSGAETARTPSRPESASTPPMPGSVIPPAPPTVVLVEHTLATYDAMIRHLEVRLARGGTPDEEAALAELRELRRRTWIAARRAAPPPETDPAARAP